jgi:hypothetical protein
LQMRFRKSAWTTEIYSYALKDELNHNLRTSYLWYQEQKAYGISYKFTQSDPLVTFDYNLYF